MPLQSSSLPTEVTIGVTDYNRERSTASIFLPNAFSLVEVVAQVAAFEILIAGLTDGFINGGGLSRRFNQTDDPPLSGGPIASNVQRKAVFVFENSFGTYQKYTIPSVDRALVLPGSKEIDIAAPAVAAYVNFMLTGLPGLPASRPVGGNGYQLTRLAAAYEDTYDRPNSR